MRRWLSLTLVMIVGLALVACGGDDDESDDGAGDGSPSATASAEAASGAAAIDRSTETPSPADDFASVLERLDESAYRITYTFTSTVGSEELEGTLTWIRATDGRERFETSSEQAGEAFELVVITELDGSQITCFDVGGFANCFRGTDGPFADLPNPAEIIFDHVLDPDRIAGVRAAGTREILGETANCYEVDVGDGTSEACVSEGNVLLFASWTAASGEGGALEATEFSSDVSDEDFEPPSPMS